MVEPQGQGLGGGDGELAMCKACNKQFLDDDDRPRLLAEHVPAHSCRTCSGFVHSLPSMCDNGDKNRPEAPIMARNQSLIRDIPVNCQLVGS